MTRGSSDHGGLDIVCEIEPPTSGDLGIVREQIAVLQPVCDAFLVPDSHLGRATVSSLAVAHEVEYLRGRAVACLNARDRNLLGFRRDLLTAAAYDVTELLLVYGDDPSAGRRAPMTVRNMLAELDATTVAGEDGRPVSFDVAVAADHRRDLAGFKHAADRVFTQLTMDSDAVSDWARATTFDGRVYAGVVVLASESMADDLEGTIPGFRVPGTIRRRLADDPDAGVQVAVEQIRALREAGAVDGVHLVPARRYRDLAAALAGTAAVG